VFANSPINNDVVAVAQITFR